jgi:hypothetical protein
MKNNIILRDCPKQKVQIDLWAFDIGGGFRGFQNVANGIHYLSILFQEKYYGIWYFNENETIVKAFDWDKATFYDVEETDKTTFQEMADSGVMNDKLIIYPNIAAEQWEELSNYISIFHFQNSQFLPIDMNANTDKNKILGSFQLAFLKVIVQQAEDLVVEDIENWEQWVKAIYGTELSIIENQTDLFCKCIDLLILQLELFPDIYRTRSDFVYDEAIDFIEKLEKSDDFYLSKSALELRVFME